MARLRGEDCAQRRAATAGAGGIVVDEVESIAERRSTRAGEEKPLSHGKKSSSQREDHLLW